MVKSQVNSNEIYYIFNAECHVSDCSVQHCAIGTRHHENSMYLL